MTKVVFKDFSEQFKWKWFLESIFRQNVCLYWDIKNRVWCRMVIGVECEEKDGWYVPLKGQLVSYPQKIGTR